MAFPTELLIMVALNADTPTLCAFALTCRRLHFVVRGVLHRHVIVDEKRAHLHLKDVVRFVRDLELYHPAPFIDALARSVSLLNLRRLVYGLPAYTILDGDVCPDLSVTQGESASTRRLRRWIAAAVNLECFEFALYLTEPDALSLIASLSSHGHLCVLVIRSFAVFPPDPGSSIPSITIPTFRWSALQELTIGGCLDSHLLSWAFPATGLPSLTYLDLSKSSEFMPSEFFALLRSVHTTLRVVSLGVDMIMPSEFARPPLPLCLGCTLEQLVEVRVRMSTRHRRRVAELDAVKALLHLLARESAAALRVLSLDFYVNTALVRAYGLHARSWFRWADPTGAFDQAVGPTYWPAFSRATLSTGTVLHVHISTWDDSGNAVADAAPGYSDSPPAFVPWRKAVRDNIQKCARLSEFNSRVTFSCKRYLSPDGDARPPEPDDLLASQSLDIGLMLEMVLSEEIPLVYNWDGESMLG
ncbi:hypothetical protein BD626DRAFT_579553 [Schizophyllum amplum]|uniref:F-box domain-containing protein n=1 Tax=Schizophyllum amplum TaxID=97359 RepID=A0A550BRE8_9AGAR|nr:hypothetical protein BD626DRAFT_579553 [Auriculariopsis ampla]